MFIQASGENRRMTWARLLVPITVALLAVILLLTLPYHRLHGRIPLEGARHRFRLGADSVLGVRRCLPTGLCRSAHSLAPMGRAVETEALRGIHYPSRPVSGVAPDVAAARKPISGFPGGPAQMFARRRNLTNG